MLCRRSKVLFDARSPFIPGSKIQSAPVIQILRSSRHPHWDGCPGAARDGLPWQLCSSAVTVGGLGSVFLVIFSLMAGYGPSFEVCAATYSLNDVPSMDASMLYGFCLHLRHMWTRCKPDYVRTCSVTCGVNHLGMKCLTYLDDFNNLRSLVFHWRYVYAMVINAEHGIKKVVVTMIRMKITWMITGDARCPSI